jgi:eukaryotic-like serine/threonine-protein kinase
MNELEIFAAAIAVADPGERAAFLDQECADRPELRRRLDQLLDAHFRSHAWLEKPASWLEQTGRLLEESGSGVAAESGPGVAESAGAIIAGRYTLIEPIGEGGMGSVWRAKQTEPVQRFVAVKLIKAGMDSKQVLARFEAERRAA